MGKKKRGVRGEKKEKNNGKKKEKKQKKRRKKRKKKKKKRKKKKTKHTENTLLKISTDVWRVHGGFRVPWLLAVNSITKYRGVKKITDDLTRKRLNAFESLIKL